MENKKKKIIRIGLVVLVGLMILIQFIRPDRSAPEVVPAEDFITLSQPPAELAIQLRAACYDCHSNETVWPWYTQLAPISWWIGNHINEGKHHLNFSEWGTLPPKKQAHKIEECQEMLDEEKMPLKSYTWIHQEAKLSDVDRKVLSDWFKTL